MLIKFCSLVPSALASVSENVASNTRLALEQLCRYFTRPALANERVQTNAAGQVVIKLKTAWRDGTTRTWSCRRWS